MPLHHLLAMCPPTLAYVGLSMRAAGEVAIRVRQLDLLYNPIVSPQKITLKGYTGWDDVEPCKQALKESLEDFKVGCLWCPFHQHWFTFLQ